MTQRPASNALPRTEPWTRWASAGVEKNAADIDRALTEIDQRDPLLQSAEANINLLLQQVSALYSATGNVYPPAPPAPAPPPEPVPTYQTIEIGADWSASWGSSSQYTGGGTDTNATYLYQGSNPEDKIGIWHFSLGTARGKTITAADMFLANINTPYQPVVTAGFGGHSFGSVPGGKPGRTYPFDVTWGRGEAKWFALPTWTYEGLSNGILQGFSIGGIGPSNDNYGYWQGVGQAAPPKLRVTYRT